MNSLQKNFIYLSQIIGVPVIDFKTNRKTGYVSDLVAGLREMYPRVSALIVRRGKKKTYVLWKDVRNIIEGKAVFVENGYLEFSRDIKISDNEILLKETFWDKQIVDISGSKVVRVNDLHLLREELNVWVVHMDIGFKGLIRRLGLFPFVDFMTRLLFSYELKDRFISWKFVQPITASIGGESLSLKVHHSRLSELHPADLADIIIDLGTDERITILNSLDNETAAHTFQELPMKVRIQLAESLRHERLVNIINSMAIDELVDLLSHLSRKRVNALLNHFPEEKVGQITSLLNMSEHVAGSIMNTEFVSIKHNDFAGTVLEKLRFELKKKESVYYIYVLDDNDALLGVVTLRQLLTSLPDKPVSEFMRKRVTKVKVGTNIKDVAEIFYKYDFNVVPVVDEQNKIKGIITMKDAFRSVFDEIKKEAEESS